MPHIYSELKIGTKLSIKMREKFDNPLVQMRFADDYTTLTIETTG